MQFIIHDSLFDEPASSARIISLFMIAAKSLRHIVLPQDYNSPIFRAWMESIGNQHRIEITQLLDSFYRTVALIDIKKKPLVACEELPIELQNIAISIDKALALAQMPFRLYVENSRNDRKFLLTFASDEQRERFIQLEKKSGIIFINGGGITELKAQIEADINSGFTMPDYAWVMFDSDSLQPGRASAQAVDLAASCDRLGVMRTQLSRRSIENYIPKSELRTWAYLGRKKNNISRDKRIATFLGYVELPSDLAHHYNMKNGLEQDRKRYDYPGDVIYADLPLKIKKGLALGFGGNVADIYHEANIMESVLRKDGSWAELNSVIAQIERHV